MWISLLKGVDIGILKELATKEALSLVSMNDALSLSKKLITSMSDKKKLEKINLNIVSKFNLAQKNYLIKDDSFVRLSKSFNLNEQNKEKLGEIIIALFFAQVLFLDDSILDLSKNAFFLKKSIIENHSASFKNREENNNIKNEDILYAPESLTYSFSFEFKNAMKNIYNGYYDGDLSVYKEGLDQIGMLKAYDIFLKHFSLRHNEAILFKKQDFLNSFKAIFIFAKEQKLHMHIDFIPFGMLLASLYDTLEHLNVKITVKNSYKYVHKLFE